MTDANDAASAGHVELNVPLNGPFNGPFDGAVDFARHVQALAQKAHLRLQLFDTDFASWRLNSVEMHQSLRHFLLSQRQARLQMVMHNTRHLEQQCPRFMLLLRDFSHAIECRVTPKNLRQLSDSFGIADEKHIVRRFHCDFFRGEVLFDAPTACTVPLERFVQIWEESEPGIHASTLGL